MKRMCDIITGSDIRPSLSLIVTVSLTPLMLATRSYEASYQNTQTVIPPSHSCHLFRYLKHIASSSDHADLSRLTHWDHLWWLLPNLGMMSPLYE